MVFSGLTKYRARPLVALTERQAAAIAGRWPILLLPLLAAA
jgi:hypothetical protein